MKKKYFLIFLMTLFCAFNSHAQTTNLLTNGDFANPLSTGWTEGGNNNWGVSGGVVTLDNDAVGDSFFEQTVSVTNGVTTTLTFDVSALATNVHPITVSIIINGTTVYSQTGEQIVTDNGGTNVWGSRTILYTPNTTGNVVFRVNGNIGTSGGGGGDDANIRNLSLTIPDHDQDGIDDVTDEDDDNDGILDINECGSTANPVNNGDFASGDTGWTEGGNNHWGFISGASGQAFLNNDATGTSTFQQTITTNSGVSKQISFEVWALDTNVNDATLEVIFDGVTIYSQTAAEIVAENGGVDVKATRTFTVVPSANSVVLEIRGTLAAAGGAGDDVNIDTIVLSPTCLDTNSDGEIDAEDLDSDGDGCNDSQEAGNSDSNGDGIYGALPTTVNAQGRVTGGAPLTGGYDGNVAAVTTAATAPPITTEPVNRTICSSSNTTFTVVATGSGLTYQWQVDPNTGTFANVPTSGAGDIYTNETTATLTLTGATTTQNNYKYRVIVTSPNNVCAPTTSNQGILTVNANPIATTNNAVVCSGTTSSSITVTATTGTPINYTIDYDAAANTAGFTDISSAVSLTGAS